MPLRNSKENSRSSLALTFLVGGLLVAVGSPASADSVYEPQASAVPQTASDDRWAVVGADGALARGKGAVSVVRGAAGAGDYIVQFNRNINDCTYLATLGDPGTGAPPAGLVSAIRKSGTSVAVLTRSLRGGRADRGFHLYVACGSAAPSSAGASASTPQVAAGDRWAVVNAAGGLVRGRGVVGVSGGGGVHFVDFDRRVDVCANAATIERPGAGAIAASSGNPTNPSRVIVTTTDVAGSSFNTGFHLFVACGATAPATSQVDVRGASVVPTVSAGDRLAVISAPFTIARQRGLVSLLVPAGGKYRLKFNRDVSNCVYVAVGGQAEGTGLAGGPIGVASATGRPDTILVVTRDRFGTLRNQSFHLVVGCG